MKRLAAGSTLTATWWPRSGDRSLSTTDSGSSASSPPLYSESFWPSLAQAISEAMQGDGTDLAALGLLLRARQPPTGRFSNLLEANAAIGCLDHPLPAHLSQLPRFCGAGG